MKWLDEWTLSRTARYLHRWQTLSRCLGVDFPDSSGGRDLHHSAHLQRQEPHLGPLVGRGGSGGGGYLPTGISESAPWLVCRTLRPRRSRGGLDQEAQEADFTEEIHPNLATPAPASGPLLRRPLNQVSTNTSRGSRAGQRRRRPTRIRRRDGRRCSPLSTCHEASASERT